MSTWIFLRGLTRESRHWGCFPETFRMEIPCARVFTPDLPGNGALCADRSPMNVDEMAECVRSQLRAQGCAPPYHLLAMSLGAMVAVAWAASHPEELLGGVLINTSVRPISPFHRRLKPGNYLRLLKLALAGGRSHDWEKTIFELTSHHAENADAVLKDWLAYRRQYPVSLGNALRQLVAAMRYRAPRAGLQIPLLILASQRDTLVDSSCSCRLAELWNTDFAEHPSAGHDLPLDDGPWVAGQVSHWLRTLCGSVEIPCLIEEPAKRGRPGPPHSPIITG